MTAENDHGYRWLPKITGDHSHLVTSYAMLDGKVKGYFLLGQNPAAGSTNARMQRKALEQLDWMVVRDLYEVESATFWKKGPEPIDLEAKSRRKFSCYQQQPRPRKKGASQIRNDCYNGVIKLSIHPMMHAQISGLSTISANASKSSMQIARD